MDQLSAKRAMKILANELKSLQQEPVDGVKVKLFNSDNLFLWDSRIFGPPGTIYSGGYFKAVLKFPFDYPFSPPTMRIVSKIWHPNIFPNGQVCISILHPPTNKPDCGELPCERWNPTQSARTILLSVISLLNEPNISSPANMEASRMYKNWKETDGQDKEYEYVIRQIVFESREVAKLDGVEIPITESEYIVKTPPPRCPTPEMSDFYMDVPDAENDSEESDSEE